MEEALGLESRNPSAGGFIRDNQRNWVVDFGRNIGESLDSREFGGRHLEHI
ncbi:hypothetical protein PVK06_019244 [Gossypium arboreum]|nr:hypothetical protein PVK06_019244 [Gossypium arboreum]